MKFYDYSTVINFDWLSLKSLFDLFIGQKKRFNIRKQ